MDALCTCRPNRGLITILHCNYCFVAPTRMLATQEQKHMKLKIIDNVGVIVIDSPNAKVFPSKIQN